MSATHTQCLLEKNNARQTAWIPTKYAKVESYVELKNDDGTWDNGWQILEAGTTMDSEYIRERGQDYKKMPSTKQKMGD